MYRVEITLGGSREYPVTKKVEAGVTLPFKRRVWAISGKSQGRRLLHVCCREHGLLDIFALNF